MEPTNAHLRIVNKTVCSDFISRILFLFLILVDDITMSISINSHIAGFVRDLYCRYAIFQTTLMHLEEESSRKIPNCAPISTASQRYQEPPRDYDSSYVLTLLPV
ncbi:hypothetical protein AVEN_169299-1 [Araneus ventricosus]|uniref:Uncharacterized protein n=1 Tax=Araneus ventricosus TaxID=182803 RepID=A0A4Y2SL09_ARAVE|nr:hypothetical protein AVEN_169299-1 [Araneus ventricosus]